MRISRKLRNLKDAATRPNVPFGAGGHKSLNLGFNTFIILLLKIILFKRSEA